MTTLIKQVAAGADDVAVAASDFGSTYTTIPMGDFSGVEYRSFDRFQNVTIPAGSTIDSATLKLWAFATSGTRSLNIRAEDTADSAALSSSAEALARPKTTALVNWQPPLWTNGQAFTSPNIATVIQEVIDNTGWASGSDLTLIIEHAIPTGGNITRHRAYEQNTTEAAEVTIDFTAPSGQHEAGGSTATVTVTVTSAGTAHEDAAGGSTATVTVTANGDGFATEAFSITATVDGPDVDLSWSARSGATGYAVERDGLIVAWDVQTTTYTDVNPGSGEHTYRVGVIG